MTRLVPTVVCDIDGVLSDNTARIAALDHDNPDWTAFHATQEDDPLRESEAALLRLLRDGGYNIVLLTNRPEAYREPTQRWLNKHAVPHHLLMMRKRGNDYHQAKINSVKELQDQGYEVALVIDDDPQHCDNIKSHCGVPVLYVHSGYYEGERRDVNAYVSQDPDANCVTAPDGSCVAGEPCMHDPKES